MPSYQELGYQWCTTYVKQVVNQLWLPQTHVNRLTRGLCVACDPSRKDNLGKEESPSGKIEVVGVVFFMFPVFFVLVVGVVVD